ncbi:MAG: hypothetical protein ACYC3K_04340 [Candidatus Nanopelagicales bacterium]
MSDGAAQSRPRGLPNTVLIVVCVIVLLAVTVAGVGVLMANVMSCDSGSDGCADRAMVATGVWAAISYLGPLGALAWGLVAKRTTQAGRLSRVVALLLIVLLPVVGLAVNLTILFGLP